MAVPAAPVATPSLTICLLGAYGFAAYHHSTTTAFYANILSSVLPSTISRLLFYLPQLLYFRTFQGAGERYDVVRGDRNNGYGVWRRWTCAVRCGVPRPPILSAV